MIDDWDRFDGAWISNDERYRYVLTRTWDIDLPRMAWIMLNPSTADAELDDPTIRRCKGFAKREGCGGIDVVNLYALRATDPQALLPHYDPEGPDNPLAWATILYDPEPAFVVAGWGAFDHPALPESKALRGYAGPPMLCLGRTKENRPRHPLYVRGEQPLELL